MTSPSRGLGRLVGAGFSSPAAVAAAASAGKRADVSNGTPMDNALRTTASPFDRDVHQPCFLGQLPSPPVHQSVLRKADGSIQERDEVGPHNLEERLRGILLAECDHRLSCRIELEREEWKSAIAALQKDIEPFAATFRSIAYPKADEVSCTSCVRQKLTASVGVEDQTGSWRIPLDDGASVLNDNIDGQAGRLQSLIEKLRADVTTSSEVVQRQLAQADIAIDNLHQNMAEVQRGLNIVARPPALQQVEGSGTDACDGIQKLENAVACLAKELSEVEHALGDLGCSQRCSPTAVGCSSFAKNSDMHEGHVITPAFARCSKGLGGG